MIPLANDLEIPDSSQGRRLRLAGAMLAILPLASFIFQYIASRRLGLERVFLHHFPVVIADWWFVPINFYIVKVIDWRRGAALYALSIIATVSNVTAHWWWQVSGVGEHLITHGGATLPSGWVHLSFAIIETTLLLASVFCRSALAPRWGLATALVCGYLATLGACAFALHGHFLLLDAAVVATGILTVLAYPKRHKRVR